MVSWTRLFSKKWKDSLVGRDILIGCAAGVFFYLLIILFFLLGAPLTDLRGAIGYRLIAISGFHYFACMVLLPLLISLASSFMWGSILLIMRVILKSDKVAFSAVILIMTIVISGGSLLAIPIGLCAAGLSLFCLMRFGLLSVGVGIFTIIFWAALPKLINVSAFYSRYSYAAFAIFAAIVLYAFYTSLGGRPVFGAHPLDD